MRDALTTATRTTSFIAIINQKGGVGKSTVTSLLANVFYFIFKKEVAIIDADYPQQTIYKRHLQTAEAISKNPSVREASKLLYKERSPIQVFPTETIAKAGQVMDSIKGQFDLVFLDIAGTLNQSDIATILKKVNHFFIPVLQEDDTFNSSKEFYEVLAKAILPQSEAVQSCQFFLNNLAPMNQAKKYRQKLTALGAPVLDEALFHYVVYERSFRSTLLPIPTVAESKTYQKEISKLHRFAQAVLNKIENKDGLSEQSNDLETTAEKVKTVESGVPYEAGIVEVLVANGLHQSDSSLAAQ